MLTFLRFFRSAVEQRKRIKKYEVSLQQYQLRVTCTVEELETNLKAVKNEAGKKKNCQCKNILEIYHQSSQSSRSGIILKKAML